ncbi:MAG: hypothetical protein ACLTOS_00015 [Ruthenibacterium lactatiformans]
MEIDIKAELVRLAEPEYAVFSRRLLPGTENVLGVRLPLLRRLARRIAKGDWAAYLDTQETARLKKSCCREWSLVLSARRRRRFWPAPLLSCQK